MTLWDGAQEKRIAQKEVPNAEISCLGLAGEESLRRGPLLIGNFRNYQKLHKCFSTEKFSIKILGRNLFFIFKLKDVTMEICTFMICGRPPSPHGSGTVLFRPPELFQKQKLSVLNQNETKFWQVIQMVL